MKLFNKYTPALAVLALPAQAFADQTGGYYGNMGGNMGYGSWFFGPLMMILFFGLLIAAVVGAFRMFGNGSDAGNRATDILDERYASGEIDEAEYTKRRKALKG